MVRLRKPNPNFDLGRKDGGGGNCEMKLLSHLNPPSAVIADFFGTLVEIDCDRPMMWELLSELGYESNLQTERIFNTHGFDGMRFPFDESIIDYSEQRRVLIEAYCRFHSVDPRKIPEIVGLLLENDTKWTVKARPGAKLLVDVCNQKNLPFVICSNWDYPLESYLQQSCLPSDLKSVVSCDLRVRKPSPEIFASAYRRTGINSEVSSMWYIGDSWDADICGAIRYGFTPIMTGSDVNFARKHVVGPVPLNDIAKAILETNR
jgi:FMN phosphatase YigB (HAD superfamily)